jgi:hypothetical protein
LPKTAQKRQVRARFAWIVTLSRKLARDVPTKKQNLNRQGQQTTAQAGAPAGWIVSAQTAQPGEMTAPICCDM